MKKLFYLFTALLLSQQLAAQIKTWNGSVSTDWYNAANWTPSAGATAGAPTAIDNVFITIASPDPVIASGNAVAKSINIDVVGSALTISSGATLTVSTNGGDAVSVIRGTLTNNGTLSVTNTAGFTSGLEAMVLTTGGMVTNSGTMTLNGGENVALNIAGSTFTNQSGGNVTSNGRDVMRMSGAGVIFTNASGATFTGTGTNTGIFAQPGSITNGGTMDITGSIELYTTTRLTNSPCGKFKVTGNFYNQSGSTLFNEGFLHVTDELSNNGTATNAGVVKSGLGTIPNSGNPSVRVNDTTPIFTYGGTFSGTVNGIFKDEAATVSAGTFSDSPPNLNAFIGNNTLPLGSQTLYAKITPAAGGCVYIVPFLYFYTPPPVFTTHPANVAVCSGSPASFTVAATDAVSYQWQISTNGGTNWTNLSNNSIYTNVTTATLNISNSAGLGSSIYRCVATNTGGPTNSNAASITLNPSTTPSSTGMITWTGAISTDWNTPCNWSPGSVPTADNEVLINNVVNDPIIASGITANTGYITLSSGAVLTVNSGGVLNVRGNANDGMRLVSATFTNDGTTDIQRPGGLPFASGGIYSTTGSAVNNGGTLTVNSNGSPFSNAAGTFVVTNNSGGVLNVINGNGFTSQAGAGTIRINIINNGTINSNCSSISGFYSFTNNGTVNINSGGITVASGKSLTNNECGKIYVNVGSYSNAGTTTNNGFIHVVNELSANSGFTNRGVLKYGTLSGTVTNTSTAAIIVKDSPTPIFTYGGASYNGTINGIYTDALATNSAGTFTPLNSFVPDAGLPIGSQTLYAKITPSSGDCFYIVPFIYVVLPTFTAQPSNTSKCAPEAASFTVAANQATSYQWQLSTDGGTNWNNITANAIYTNVTATTLNISNTAGLHNNQYRCVATNAGGSANSNAATLTVITGVSTPTGTLTWTGTFGTDWNQACNWSPASVPGAGNDVVIPNTTNKPTIAASINALAKTVEVQTGALLTVAANGTITINGSRTVASIAAAFHNIGTTENNGIISIGTTTASGTNGLLNKGNFNNNAAAELRIDNATSAGLNNNSGTFNNAAKIIVGLNTSTGSSGVSNSSTFNNQTTGEIRIDRTTNNGFANSTGGTTNNDGRIIIGATAALTNVALLNDAAFNNNAGGEMTLDRTSGSGLFQRTGTFTNAGKITLGSIAAIGGSGFLVDATFTNTAAGEITITNTATGIYIRSGVLNNAGLITLNSSPTGLRNSVTFNNQSCGRLIALNTVNNDPTGTVTNLGYIFAGGDISASGTFTNNGVLKKSSSSGTIINASNPSLIVNNNPTNSTIFTYGGTYDGVVNGIFTDANATASAGTYTQAANTFAPLGTLPVGSQTLYAKITPSGGGCFYVVPFTYVMAAVPPTFTTQPISVSLCAGGAASFTVAASNAASYQWQISTNGGGSWANISAAGVYTNVTATTLNISNITGLNGNQYRCVATGAGGNANSNAATLSVSPATLTFVSPTDDISTNAGTKQATQTISATNKLTAPAVVTYRAGNAITLNPGFEARNGVTFLIQTGGCN